MKNARVDDQRWIGRKRKKRSRLRHSGDCVWGCFDSTWVGGTRITSLFLRSDQFSLSLGSIVWGLGDRGIVGLGTDGCFRPGPPRNIIVFGVGSCPVSGRKHPLFRAHKPQVPSLKSLDTGPGVDHASNHTIASDKFDKVFLSRRVQSQDGVFPDMACVDTGGSHTHSTRS